MRSPIFELVRMKAADTRASRAIADWTPLAVVCRSLITAEIDTFMSDVSITKTNMAMASKRASRGLPSSRCSTGVSEAVLTTHPTVDPGLSTRGPSVRQDPFRPLSFRHSRADIRRRRSGSTWEGRGSTREVCIDPEKDARSHRHRRLHFPPRPFVLVPAAPTGL